MYNNITLGKLIEFLETMDPNLIVKDGFGSPHSDRGSYAELAFEPAAEAQIGTMLQYARSAVNESFEGYKGGVYVMTLDTPVYIGEWGCCGDSITPTHFEYWKLTSGKEQELTKDEIIRIFREAMEKAVNCIRNDEPTAAEILLRRTLLDNREK